MLCVLCQLLCSSISYALIKSSLTPTCLCIFITESNCNVNNLYRNILRVVISITFFKVIPSTTIWSLILWSWETANFLNSMFLSALPWMTLYRLKENNELNSVTWIHRVQSFFCQHTWTEWLYKPQHATLGAIFYQREEKLTARGLSPWQLSEFSKPRLRLLERWVTFGSGNEGNAVECMTPL